QDINNCGPAALSLYLRYYGWDGDQFSISQQLRSDRRDRNINVEELLYYTRSYVGWLESTFRVGGTTEQIKQFLAAGIPVVTEETFYFEEPYWPDDDLWAGHYLLITGYDDASSTFAVQDTFYGPDKQVSYEKVDELWQPFNRVFILIYRPDQEETVKAILGEHWDVEYNRQAALETAQAEIDANPEDALAWFNLGSNLVYFERYDEAADAYDEARRLGLPQRMLRYQFGPFFAYFHSGRIEDLLALTEYALKITYNSEEAFLWTGWGLYRQGDGAGAIDYFRRAYEANNTSIDAQYALEFMGASP
ncbi:MAG: C39 family peptidase, partial [Anaerolineales bacterium]|nr:C39 family peptidase [Anaerolineales bacterium]